MQADAVLEQLKGHWLVRETIGALRRTLARLDVTSRSLIALVDQGSCFAGTFYELALACDRIYMLDLPDSPDAAPALRLNAANFGRYPEVNGLTRLQTRFNEDGQTIAQLQGLQDSGLRADQALALGLVTLTPDDIDWEDEIRVMLEERASLSPDALTGMEASLRFPGQGNHGDARVRAAVGLAELDLHPSERRGRGGRAEAVRHRQEGKVRLEANLTTWPPADRSMCRRSANAHGLRISPQ